MSPSPASVARAPRGALVVAVLGSSLAFIDGSVVNVALPVMQRDLRADAAAVQWVVEAYALMLASLVLVGGALGDRFGRRRVFVLGLGVFSLASIGVSLSPGPSALIVARAVQGVGGAMLVPGSLALISAAYADRSARGAAIGTWSAASAVTSAIGPVAGGWVVAHASWRWLFLFNAPAGLAIAWLAMRTVSESRDESSAHEVDVAGSVLATLGLGAIVYALIDAPRAGGIGAPRVLVLLAAGTLTLVAFVVVEARRRAPMVPLGLFRSRTFAGSNLLTLLLYAALGGAMFFVPFQLIQVQHQSPAAAGAALLPFVALISVMSRWTGAFADRHGPRGALVLGPLVAALGFALLGATGASGGYVRGVLPGVLALGVGMGITIAPLTAAVMGSVDAQHAGVASGINNAVARAAGLLAIAALGVVLRHRFDAVLDGSLLHLPLDAATRVLVDAQREHLGAAEFPSALDAGVRANLRDAFEQAFSAGFRVSMFVCAALAALSSLAALAWIERRAD